MDRRDTIGRQRVGRNWRWSEREIALIQAGQPVPSRSPSACEKKQHQLGIFTHSQNRKLPYEPPRSIPGKIPWPAWWNSAHRLRSEGYRLTDIAGMLDKHLPQVRIALYPDYREKCLTSKRNAYQRIKNDPEFLEIRRKSQALKDHKRIAVRVYARAEWRAAGGKPRDLEKLYRKYECL